MGMSIQQNYVFGDFIFPLVLAGAALLLVAAKCVIVYIQNQKNPPQVEVVEFYPPKGINPVEASFIMDNDIVYSDVESLIYYWVSKNYMTIRFDSLGEYVLRRNEGPFFEMDAAEQQMFEALFSKDDGDSIDSTTIKREYGEIFSGLRRQYLKSVGVFEAAIPTLGVILTKYIFSGRIRARRKGAALILLLKLIAALVVTTGFCIYWLYKASQSLLYSRRWGRIKKSCLFKLPFFVFSISVLTVGICGGFYLLSVDAPNLAPFSLLPTLLFGFGIALLSIAVGVLRFPIRKNELTLQLMGFHRFLSAAEVSRIEMLVDENPYYYLDTLPFAQVFGLTDKWVGHFKDGTLPKTVDEALRERSKGAVV